MSKSRLIFRNQFTLFRQEKGMIVFYLLSIAVMGIIVPMFMRGIESALTMAAFLTVMFLKPMLSDCLGGRAGAQNARIPAFIAHERKKHHLGKGTILLFFCGLLFRVDFNMRRIDELVARL